MNLYQTRGIHQRARSLRCAAEHGSGLSECRMNSGNISSRGGSASNTTVRMSSSMVPGPCDLMRLMGNLLANDRGYGFVFVSRRGKRSLTGGVRLFCIFVLAAGGLALSQRGYSQESVNPVMTSALPAMGVVADTDAPPVADTAAEPDAPPATNATNSVVDTRTSVTNGAVMTPQPVHRKQKVA